MRPTEKLAEKLTGCRKSPFKLKGLSLPKGEESGENQFIHMSMKPAIISRPGDLFVVVVA